MEILHQEFLGNPLMLYLAAALIIIAGLALKKYGAIILGKLLYQLFGKKSNTENERSFLYELKEPIQAILLFIFFYSALNLLTVPERFLANETVARGFTILNVLIRILWVVLFSWLAFKLVDYITGVMRSKAELTSSKFDDQLVPFFKEMSKILIVVFAFIFILGVVFNLNVTSLIAGLGIGGLAIALAAQDTLANLFGSLAIFLDKPFQVGDMIQVDDIIGEVTHVGFRSTRIRTIEKSYLTLPNRMLVDRKVDNLTLRTFRRVRFFVGLTYDTPETVMKAVIADIQNFIDEHPHTNQDGVVRFYEFGSSSLNILVQYFIDTMDWSSYLKIREEINYKISEIVGIHSAEFAFPTTTVHINQLANSNNTIK